MLFTDEEAASMLDTPRVYSRVPSIFRTPSTESIAVLAARILGAQAVPVVQRPKILAVLRVFRVLNAEILQHSSKYLE